MKKFNKKIIVTVLAIAFVFGAIRPIPASATVGVVPTLGVSATYAVYSDAGETNANAGTRIWGNVGDNSTVHTGLDATQVPPPSVIDAGVGVAAAAFTTAYGQLAAQSGPTISLSGTPTVTPGVYDIGTSTLNGAITLNGAGVYIFKSTSSISTTGAAQMSLIGGATACNVFWQIPTAMTIGAGAHIEGTIITGPGGANITLASAASLVGRAFAHTQITLDNNSITEPVCTGPATLNVIKHVVNDNGGTALANAWDLVVATNNSGTGIGHAVGSETGTTYTLQTGKQYSVSENSGPTGYSETLTGCTIASAVAGTAYTCTITNNDVAPRLTLNKTVVGGSALATAWTLGATGTIGSPTNLSGTTPVDSNVVFPSGTFQSDTYTLSESAGPANYTASSWVCTYDTESVPVTNSSVVIPINYDVTCTITNTYYAPSHGGGYIRPPVAVFLPSINIISTPVVIAPIIPKLPKTGYPPQEKNTMLPIVLLSGLSLVSIFLYFAQKKQTT